MLENSSMSKSKNWSEKEIIILKNNYEKLGSKQVEFLLPDRKNGAILIKANKLGLKYNNRKLLKYEEKYFRDVIDNSISFLEIHKKLGLSKHGNNRVTIKKYIELYNINISHLENSHLEHTTNLKIKNTIPLVNILTENSTYQTNSLKNRLYKEGLKNHFCELCGQNEIWNGAKMSLILDHINGVNNDNRIENLRIVCPNCNATLPTHCRGSKGLIIKKYS